MLFLQYRVQRHHTSDPSTKIDATERIRRRQRHYYTLDYTPIRNPTTQYNVAISGSRQSGYVPKGPGGLARGIETRIRHLLDGTLCYVIPCHHGDSRLLFF